jgi:hypothetical protein
LLFKLKWTTKDAKLIGFLSETPQICFFSLSLMSLYYEYKRCVMKSHNQQFTQYQQTLHLLNKMTTTTFANGYPGPDSRQAQKRCEVQPLMGYQPPPSTNIYNLIVFKCMYVIYMLN